MPEVGRTDELARPGMERVSFAQSPPMSTYLVAFVFGELTKVSSTVAGRGGTEVNVWSVPELAGNLGEAASVAAASLAFYGHLTGVAFALPKADMVAVPGKGGAMENWGLLLFDERRFLVNPSTEGEYEKQECRNVVSKNDEFCVYIRGICTKRGILCPTARSFVSKMMNFVSTMMNFCRYATKSRINGSETWLQTPTGIACG